MSRLQLHRSKVIQNSTGHGNSIGGRSAVGVGSCIIKLDQTISYVESSGICDRSRAEAATGCRVEFDLAAGKFKVPELRIPAARGDSSAKSAETEFPSINTLFSVRVRWLLIAAPPLGYFAEAMKFPFRIVSQLRVVVAMLVTGVPIFFPVKDDCALSRRSDQIQVFPRNGQLFVIDPFGDVDGFAGISDVVDRILNCQASGLRSKSAGRNVSAGFGDINCRSRRLDGSGS